MRLGTMLGGRAWAALKSAASDQSRAENIARKDELERKRRRLELDALGFRPVKDHSNWGAE